VFRLILIINVSILLANRIMHLILMIILVIFVAIFWLIKFNIIPMIYTAMIGLVFLGGIRIIITYIRCICPNYTLGFGGAAIFLVVPTLLTSKSDIVSNWLLLPYSAYFFFYKSLHWLTLICLFLLLILILTNYLDISKGRFCRI